MKYHMTMLLVCFGLFLGMAQNGGREKIKKLKIAYFTENLDLTEKEAQQFWPVYNAYDDKNHELRVVGLNKIKRQIKQNSGMSEAEAAEILDKIQNIEQQVYENGVNLINKLRKFLPAVKIIQLKKAERDFNRDLMKKFRDRRGRRKSMP
jgi:Spy/CpxP family protein refolding chaperone